MMRPQGATTHELGAFHKRDRSAIKAIEQLRDERGYDIRSFKITKNDPRYTRASGSALQVHKLVGKMRWDGSYRSFIDPTKNRGPLRRR